MAEFKKTNAKVSFFRKSQIDYAALGENVIDGAIYFVEDGTVGRIYVNGKCYGEANLTNAVTEVALETEGENSGKIKVTYTSGEPTYIPLPEGRVYEAGTGIQISDENVISALDDSLDEDLVVTGVTVGNYSDGKTISKGTSLKELLKAMLTKEIDCKVKSTPKVTLTGVAPATKVVGEEITGTLDYSFTDGSFEKPNGSTVAAGCVASNPVYSTELPHTVTLGPNTFKVTVDYSASTAELKTNLGNPSAAKIDAGTVTSNTITINGTYPVFATTVDANTLTQQTLKTWNGSAGKMTSGNIVLIAHTKNAPRKFSVPRKATKLQQLNTLSGKMEDVAIASYTETTETRTFGGTDVTYYVYTYTGDAEGSVTVDVTF